MIELNDITIKLPWKQKNHLVSFFFILRHKIQTIYFLNIQVTVLINTNHSYRMECLSETYMKITTNYVLNCISTFLFNHDII